MPVFRVALGGHRITVTHSDGWPVVPVEGDAVLIGMGERYDLLTTLADGVFPLVAAAEGKNASAFGLVRTGAGAAPAPTVTPPQLSGQVLTLANLTAAPPVRLPAKPIDASLSVALDFDSDNPGQWLTHCHNEFHLAAGMATVMSYHT